MLSILRNKGIVLAAGLALAAVFAVGCGEVDNLEDMDNMPAQNEPVQNF